MSCHIDVVWPDDSITCHEHNFVTRDAAFKWIDEYNDDPLRMYGSVVRVFVKEGNYQDCDNQDHNLGQDVV